MAGECLLSVAGLAKGAFDLVAGAVVPSAKACATMAMVTALGSPPDTKVDFDAGGEKGSVTHMSQYDRAQIKGAHQDGNKVLQVVSPGAAPVLTSISPKVEPIIEGQARRVLVPSSAPAR